MYLLIIIWHDASKTHLSIDNQLKKLRPDAQFASDDNYIDNVFIFHNYTKDTKSENEADKEKIS